MTSQRQVAALLLFALTTSLTGCSPGDPVVDEEVNCCPEGVWREMNPIDGREPSPNWCTLPGKPTQGLTAPPADIATLLRLEPLIRTEEISCPTDHTQWLPFTAYTTAGLSESLGEDWILDDDGVVMANTNQFDPGSGYTYSFGPIASFLVRRFGDAVLEGPEDEIVASVVANADWLVDNAEYTSWEGHAVYNWPYPWPGLEVGAPGPWVSAYATSVAIPGLIGAWCLTEDERYLETASGALRSLAVPAIQGGTASWITEDLVWLEEGTDSSGLSTRILNGHIASIAGAWTVGTWANNDLAWAIYDASVAATEPEMHLFDPGFISMYLQWALPEYWPMVAHTTNYNRFHTVELSWLHQVTGNNYFLKSALDLARYDHPGFTIETSETLAGQADYALNRRMRESWTAPSGGWTEWTLQNRQDLAGMTLWANRPGERPDRFQLEVQTDEGEELIERKWPAESCADTFVPFDSSEVSRVRMQVFRDDDGPITMRSAGIHSTRGMPSAVAQFGHHGAANRPAHMFQEVGWYYPRIAWVTIDTQDSFEDLTLSWSGWLSQIGMPIITAADALDDLAPIEDPFRWEDDLLLIDLVDVPRFVQVEFPVQAYSLERRMWAEGR